MDDSTTELTERFERYCNTKDNALPPEVLTELQLMVRLYSITPEELDFKWQAYMMKIGGEENKMDLKTARDFKRNMQDALERESRGKAQQQRNEAKRVAPTPRAKGGDMYDMYVIPLTLFGRRGEVSKTIADSVQFGRDDTGTAEQQQRRETEVQFRHAGEQSAQKPRDELTGRSFGTPS